MSTKIEITRVWNGEEEINAYLNSPEYLEDLRKNFMFSMMQDFLHDAVLSDKPTKIPSYGHYLLSQYDKCFPGILEKEHEEWLDEKINLINKKQEEENNKLKEKYKNNPIMLQLCKSFSWLVEE